MTLPKKGKSKIYWAAFLSLMLIKFGYYGFKYYPVLDDWIQYGGYPLYPNIFKDVILRIGTYTTRPIASFSDPYLLGQFWGKMGIPFVIMTLLHTASAYFIYNVLHDHGIKVGVPFLLIFGLLPLGTEATYWISASSRLVVGIFWMSLSLYLLNIYIKGGNKVYAIGVFITHLFSMGYYEQVIVLSCFCMLLMMVVNWKRLKTKWVAAIPFINFAAIAFYYQYFGSKGNAAVRGQLIKESYLSHATVVLDKVAEVWIQVQIPLMKNGFIRGLDQIVKDGAFFYLSIIVFLSFAAFVMSIDFRKRKITLAKDIAYNCAVALLGLILFFAPYAPNLLLETVWICNRNAFPSFIGFGLLVEGILGLVFRGKTGEFLKGLVILAATFAFLIVNVSEITDYKSVSEIDRIICSNIVQTVDDPAFFDGDQKALLFDTQSTYIEQNSYYHDHIHNVTSSDWALTGCVRAIAENVHIKYLIPIQQEQHIQLDQDMLTNSILLGLEKDFSVSLLQVGLEKSGDLSLERLDGTSFGTLLATKQQEYIFQR